MTVRTFLGLFGQERRGYKVVGRIRRTLKRHKLATQPDFENENIDSPIKIVPQPDTPIPELQLKSGAQDGILALMAQWEAKREQLRSHARQ